MKNKKVVMDLVRLHMDLVRIKDNTEDPVNRLIYQAVASQVSDAVAELAKPEQKQNEEEELEIGTHDIRIMSHETDS